MFVHKLKLVIFYENLNKLGLITAVEGVYLFDFDTSQEILHDDLLLPSATIAIWEVR